MKGNMHMIWRGHIYGGTYKRRWCTHGETYTRKEIYITRRVHLDDRTNIRIYTQRDTYHGTYT